MGTENRMNHFDGLPMQGKFNERMQEYLRREVGAAIDIMLRDDTLFHVFDVDQQGRLVFVMAIVPRSSLAAFEANMQPSAPFPRSDAKPQRAATPGPREGNVTPDTEGK
jgi:hypothetical protein